MLLFSCHAVAYYSFAVIGFSFLVDNHSVINSLYMASVTFTTIGMFLFFSIALSLSLYRCARPYAAGIHLLDVLGYGDLTPTTTGARLYLIFLATYGVAILGIFLGVLVRNSMIVKNNDYLDWSSLIDRLVVSNAGRRHYRKPKCAID